MNKKDMRTVQIGQDKEGKFHIENAPDLIPTPVAEEMMNLAADVTMKQLAESHAEEIAKDLCGNDKFVEAFRMRRTWMLVAVVEALCIIALCLRSKGWI